MKRTLFVLSFLAMFAGSVFGQNAKLDNKLKDKEIGRASCRERVYVLV